MTKYGLIGGVVGLLMFGLCAGCGSQSSAPAAGTTPKRVTLVQYSDVPVADHYRQNMLAGLTAAGLVEGRDYRLTVKSAQGEMAVIPSLIDAAAADNADVLVIFQPQVLYAAIPRAPQLKKVFAILDDPFSLGAGRSDSEHLANITGQYLVPDYARLVDMIRASRPATRRLGVIFQSGDDDASLRVTALGKAAQAQGMELETVGFATSGDISVAANALAGRGVDGYVHLLDPYYVVTLTALDQVARQQRVPLYSMVPDAQRTACLTSATDMGETSRRFALLLARVIRGEDPTVIPFENNREVMPQLIINQRACAAAGLVLPPEVLARATATVD